jgi:DNA-binding Xre family transcriptional regulator
MIVKANAKPSHSSVVLLDRAKSRAKSFAAMAPRVVTSAVDLKDSISASTKDSLWVSYASELTDALVRQVGQTRHSLGFGLFLHELDLKSIPPLASAFRRIAYAAGGGFLPTQELAEALDSPNRENLFIGGFVNPAAKTITFWRGDLNALTVPLTAFAPSGSGTKPDFADVQVIDSGQTVRLGKYEAAVGAILYEFDPIYRRETAKRRRAQDRSFGAALRRLRKQRGLAREDFEPAISAKTIARIEQGIVTRVQRKTLEKIAKRLAVRPEEVKTY